MKRQNSNPLLVVLILVSAILFAGCGEKATPTETNLLVNASFEEVSDGIPTHWQIKNFRGLMDSKAATFGVDRSASSDGEASFYFKADHDTERFYMLSQEIRVRGVSRVRVRAAIKTVDVGKIAVRYPQANIALTYYSENHERFSSVRFADARTEKSTGTSEGWIQVSEVFKLPLNTAYIELHCVLGMDGQIWFDDLSLEVPHELPWKDVSGEVFTHYWLGDRGYPEGSIELQQRIHDNYAIRLGIPRENREDISYYLYPDTASIRDALGIKGYMHVDYKRREIHTINPVDDHEIVHLLTDPFGTLPKVLAEGTAFYLMDDFNGEPILRVAQDVLRAKQMPSLAQMLDSSTVRRLDPAILLPAAASFVGYLIEVGGTERFLELHRLSRADLRYDGVAAAFEEAYGAPLREAEAMWLRVLARADFSEVEQSEGRQ